MNAFRKIALSVLFAMPIVAEIPGTPLAPVREAKADGFLRLCRVWWIPAGGNRWEVYVLCEGETAAANQVARIKSWGRPAFWEFAK